MGGHTFFVAEIGGFQFYQLRLFVNLGTPFRRKCQPLKKRRHKKLSHFCLAWTYWVQKETMWSLILHVVCISCIVCMYAVCGVFLFFFGKIDHCIHIHDSHGPWTQRSMGRVTHATSTDVGQRSSRGQSWFKFFKKGSLYPHTLMNFHGTWIQWSFGRVTHLTSTDLLSKVI